MQSGIVRQAPLPDGVTELLRIATGEDAATEKAMRATDRSREEVEQAAAFFIENILLAHDADSYRVLGADAKASSDELRRNMALIMRYLHPDLDANGERSMFINRVTEAWNKLKTPEKRAAYDRQQKNCKQDQKQHPNRKPRSHGKKPTGKGVVVHKNVPALQPLSRKRQLRGTILRKLLLLLMKISGRT